MKSSQGINIEVLNKYQETRDRKYLEEWYSSEGAVVQSMRLANHASASPTYGPVIGRYLGERGYAHEREMVNPDLLTYAYEAIGELLYNWDPDKSQLSTYLYNYGPSRLMRIRDRDLGEDTLEYDDLSNYQDLISNYEEYNRDKENALITLRKMEKEIESRGNYQNKLVYQALIGKLSTEEVISKMGIAKENYWYYKKQTQELMRQFGGDTINE